MRLTCIKLAFVCIFFLAPQAPASVIETCEPKTSSNIELHGMEADFVERWVVQSLGNVSDFAVEIGEEFAGSILLIAKEKDPNPWISEPVFATDLRGGPSPLTEYFFEEELWNQVMGNPWKHVSVSNHSIYGDWFFEWGNVDNYISDCRNEHAGEAIGIDRSSKLVVSWCTHTCIGTSSNSFLIEQFEKIEVLEALASQAFHGTYPQLNESRIFAYGGFSPSEAADIYALVGREVREISKLKVQLNEISPEDEFRFSMTRGEGKFVYEEIELAKKQFLDELAERENWHELVLDRVQRGQAIHNSQVAADNASDSILIASASLIVAFSSLFVSSYRRREGSTVILKRDEEE